MLITFTVLAVTLFAIAASVFVFDAQLYATQGRAISECMRLKARLDVRPADIAASV